MQRRKTKAGEVGREGLGAVLGSMVRAFMVLAAPYLCLDSSLNSQTYPWP